MMLGVLGQFFAAQHSFGANEPPDHTLHIECGRDTVRLETTDGITAAEWPLAQFRSTEQLDYRDDDNSGRTYHS